MLNLFQYLKTLIMKNIFSFILVLTTIFGASAQEFQSPNGNFKMTFSIGNDGTPLYQLFFKNKEVIRKSKLGLELQKDKKEMKVHFQSLLARICVNESGESPLRILWGWMNQTST